MIDEVRSGLDEKTVKSIAKATAATEVAKLHNIIMEEFNEFKAKVEEEVSKRGVDVEVIRRLVDEVRNSLLGELDKRVLHLVDMINEQSNSIKDVLDLVNEVLKLETSFEEELGRLRSEIRKHLSEEGLEEMIYRTMIRRGIIRKKHRRWVLLAVGLGISAAIIAGFIINPVVTFITVAMAIVILLRW